jgi:hypothetical protein
MAHTGNRVDFTVVQFGDLKRAEAENSIGVAARAQSAFGFSMYPDRLDVDFERFRLPNNGVDLEAAAKEPLKRLKWPRPLVMLTSLPFGDPDYGKDPDYFFYSGDGINNEEAVIISTYVWEHLPGRRRLQTFLLYQLAYTALGSCIDIPVHDETRGCLNDYCENPQDIDRGLDSGPFCSRCEQEIERELRLGTLSVAQIAAVRRIFNRAIERKVCFCGDAIQSGAKTRLRCYWCCTDRRGMDCSPRRRDGPTSPH